MSDSETTAPAETPVPAACAEIKANLDKCVAANGAEGCEDLLEAFAACVKSAAAETSSTALSPPSSQHSLLHNSTGRLNDSSGGEMRIVSTSDRRFGIWPADAPRL
ncbi:unnamed protein product [Arctogadus glacialis]